MRATKYMRAGDIPKPRASDSYCKAEIDNIVRHSDSYEQWSVVEPLMLKQICGNDAEKGPHAALASNPSKLQLNVSIPMFVQRYPNKTQERMASVFDLLEKLSCTKYMLFTVRFGDTNFVEVGCF